MQNILKKICLGTGELLKDNIDTRLNVINRFLKQGGELIDTARIYYDGKSLKKLEKIKTNYKLIAKVSYFEKDRNISIKKKLEEYQSILKRKKIDFFLTHWPSEANQDNLIKSLIFLKTKKKVENIGLGNIGYRKLKKMNPKILYHLDAIQIELNIFNYFYQKKLLNFCKKKNILVFGYSPIRWCKFKKINKNLKKQLTYFKSKYNINFSDLCLLFSIFNNVVPILSIKNPTRLNRIINLNKYLFNKDLKEKLIKFESKIRKTEFIDPKKIFYKIEDKYINIEKITFDKKNLNMIIDEIKDQKSSLKPIIFKKLKKRYIVLDGKIRCKGLYQLNSKKKIYGIIL